MRKINIAMKKSHRKSTRGSRGSLRQLNRELDLLYRAARVINSSLEIDQILAVLIEKARHLLGVVGCSVWLIDPNTEELVCRQAAGRQSDLVCGWRLPIGTGVVGWIAKSGERVLIHDTRKDARHFKRVDKKTGLEIRSIMGVPLKSKDNIIGALQAVDTAPNRFNRRRLKTMAGLAASAGVAITNANLFARAQRQIAIRKETEKKLRKRETELVINSQNLKEINTAMKVVLKKRAEDKKRFEESVLMNVRKLIAPYLNKLGESELNDHQTAMIEILKNNLNDIVSPFSHRLSLKHLGLTRREFDIANLICQGKRNSEIARFIGITQRTVETHRRNLRAKLGINNRKINLRVYLTQLGHVHDHWIPSTTKPSKSDV
jgi:DNA-binding CsgD family transcriptional regulator/putative methionine-R-sulfoxide reductase with GAF domain